jgi:hypothetical protein
MEGCSCECTQRFSDLLRAAQPIKKSSLIKVTCANCERGFWTNFEKQYCFNCEAKKRKKGGICPRVVPRPFRYSFLEATAPN